MLLRSFWLEDLGINCIIFNEIFFQWNYFSQISPALFSQITRSIEFFNIGLLCRRPIKLYQYFWAYHPNIVDCEHCNDFGAGFFFKDYGKMRTEVFVELITGNFWVHILWGLVFPYRWTTRQIYWEIHNYWFLNFIVNRIVSLWKIIEKKLMICKLIFHTNWSFSWVIQTSVIICQQIKNCL